MIDENLQTRINSFILYGKVFPDSFVTDLISISYEQNNQRFEQSIFFEIPT
jgi:hypothetical protein